MESVKQKIEQLNWAAVAEGMNNNGHAILPGILSNGECEVLKRAYNANSYRKTVVMERYRYGLGEYKYFNYPLPILIQCIRENIYNRLAPIANSWMSVLKTGTQYPETLKQFQQLCHNNDQTKPTVLILKYGPGGHNTMHRDLYGDIFFPIQAVLFLSQPGTEYTGGEFILAQQIPRAQSKITAITPNKGDIMLFTTNYRPQKGSKGYYRVNVKHGVSEVKHGKRYTLGIIFHDANS